ncbi:TetR/AcrR family transcriptional regulator [Pantoea sp. B65]|uniref:TetR/AcrR family transcriptional regulator n=1 Tax=Pantoea sp. B65 TaxID=2813359 RepID=UPI0039B6DE6B
MAQRGRPRSFDRQSALTAAMKIFWQKGYTATSMADLYQAMGINSPSLYAAFGSKEELYEEVLTYYQQSIAPLIWGPLESAGSAREAVRQWLHCSATTLTSGEFPPGCMVTLSMVASEGYERLGEIVMRSRQAGVSKLRARLDQAVAAGELASTIDTAALSRLYVGIQQGMSIQARDGAGTGALLAMAEMAMGLWPDIKRAA